MSHLQNFTTVTRTVTWYDIVFQILKLPVLSMFSWGFTPIRLLKVCLSRWCSTIHRSLALLARRKIQAEGSILKIEAQMKMVKQIFQNSPGLLELFGVEVGAVLLQHLPSRVKVMEAHAELFLCWSEANQPETRWCRNWNLLKKLIFPSFSGYYQMIPWNRFFLFPNTLVLDLFDICCRLACAALVKILRGAALGFWHRVFFKQQYYTKGLRDLRVRRCDKNWESICQEKWVQW